MEIVVNPDTGDVIDFQLSDKDKGFHHVFLSTTAKMLLAMLDEADHPERLGKALGITIHSMGVHTMRKRQRS